MTSNRRETLRGERIAVTRGGELADRLRAEGANVLGVSALRIVPLDQGALREALGDMDRYDWLLITSRNSATMVARAFTDMGESASSWMGRTRLAAIGSSTADALRELGLRVDLVPPRANAESLLESLQEEEGIERARILLPRAADARDVLPNGLRALGAVVDDIPIYRAERDIAAIETLARELAAGRVDLITLTSGSAVRFLVDAIPADVLLRVPVATIGPVTTRAARDAGFRIAAEAREASIRGLVDAIVTSAFQR